MTIRIFTIFKNNIFISALEPFLLSNGIEIVSSCNNSALAVDWYKSVATKTDIVIMDLNWTDSSYTVSGDSLINRLRKINPAIKIIGATSFFEARVLSRIKSLGVQGYFFRSMDNLVEGVKECIEAVQKGDHFYSLKENISSL